jgi:MEMO1 family protein
MIRQPAVAGQFYPARAEALRQQLQQLLPEPRPEAGKAVAVVSPHAGYVYSGRVAADTLARVEIPELVIILGPNHRGAGKQLAVSGAEAWATPLGEVPLDLGLRPELLAACPDVALDDLAHRHEHSLEVQVPLLQLFQPDLRLLPICIGQTPLEMLRNFGRHLGRLLARRGEPCLLVASSDMTHYESAAAARRKDLAALDKILQLDAEGLYRLVCEQRISMCGVLPCVVMLEAAKELGGTSATLVGYANSGEVTGDEAEVVGYAGVVIH